MIKTRNYTITLHNDSGGAIDSEDVVVADGEPMAMEPCPLVEAVARILNRTAFLSPGDQIKIGEPV